MVRFHGDVHPPRPSTSDGGIVREGSLANDENIAPSMIYAYAALQERVPFANGAPNLTVDIPVMLGLSRKKQAPIAARITKRDRRCSRQF